MMVSCCLTLFDPVHDASYYSGEYMLIECGMIAAGMLRQC